MYQTFSGAVLSTPEFKLVFIFVMNEEQDFSPRNDNMAVLIIGEKMWGSVNWDPRKCLCIQLWCVL